MENITDEGAKEIYSYFRITFNKERKKAYKELKKAHSRTAEETILKNAEQAALGTTIKASFSEFKKRYPADQLWDQLYEDTLICKAKVNRVPKSVAALKSAVGAHNTWVSVSGTCFEQMAQLAITNALANSKESSIKVIFPGDLKKMLDDNRISAAKTIKELLYRCAGKREDSHPIDLFCIYEKGESSICFAAIQLKTSARERFRKEKAPAAQIYKNNFFSAAILLRGGELQTKANLSVINEEQNWDRVYVLSGIDTIGRIVRTNGDMEEIAADLIKAKNKHYEDSSKVHDPF